MRRVSEPNSKAKRKHRYSVCSLTMYTNMNSYNGARASKHYIRNLPTNV